MTGVADQSLPDETIAGEATTDPLLVPVFIEQRERLATVTAERDEWKSSALQTAVVAEQWKQRAEKAEEVIEKARSKYKNVWMQLYDDDIERLTDERDQLQERVEELERLARADMRFYVEEQLQQALHASRVVRAWGYVSGGEPDEAVDAFDSAITNMSEFFASRSGYPDTTETPRVERLVELLGNAREILEGLFKAAQIDGRYDWTAVERFLRSVASTETIE